MKGRTLLVALFVSCSLSSVTFGQEHGFVHPLKFRDTPEEREAVLKYIVAGVEQSCAKLGITDFPTRRAVEEGELDAFKSLTQVKNRLLLNRVIDECLRLEISDYATILAVDEGEVDASQKSLEWE